MTTFVAGSAVKFFVAFTDGPTGPAVNPTTVTLNLRPPNGGALQTYTQGQMISDGTGQFRIAVTLTVAGLWAWEWEGGGAAPIVQKGEIFVESRI